MNNRRLKKKYKKNEKFKAIEGYIKMAKAQLEEEGSINSDWFSQEIANQLRFLDEDYGYVPNE